MALDLRSVPRCLSGDPTGEVWPGDDAVDLAASDLSTWCAQGGREGLVLRPGSEPTTILWRPLTPQALAAVQSATVRDPAAYVYEAAAYGVLPQPAAGLVREPGGRRLSETSLTRLASVRMPLPLLAAYDALAEAEGRTPSGGDRSETVEASLAEVLGLHILAATFRLARPGR